MKKIMITGSRGYVGRNLEWFLTKKGFDVKGCDRVSGETVGWLASHPDFLREFNTVIHCAALVGIEMEGEYQRLIEDNLVELERILASCKKGGVDFVFFSSSGIWQTDEIGPYVMSKRLGEMMVKEMIPNAVIIRPSNIVGAAFGGGFDTVENGHILPKLYYCSTNKKNFIINGDGGQIRDYIHVKYICNRLQRVLESSGETKIIEACSGKSYSVFDVINEWIDKVDPNLKITLPRLRRRSDPQMLSPTKMGVAFPLEQSENSLSLALNQYLSLIEDRT